MAYFNQRKEAPPEVETNVWSCTNEGCSGWMRENFTFDNEPRCPLCDSDMKKDIKTLPQIN
ncbi:Cold-inducible protein YdjO [Alteribacillus persepolensis]|uniref:Cold-inducible protein YdjO n=1 Tax=Alteribacillus persepolensis TaxID=568899 RepID=A0A1G7Y8P5_9BACI|nr:cold-shock protein [Alteribacillus persepolensis]SDG92686.1 Cold-inducible protein YdjO [Alteribacillus persepolensis]